MTKRNPATPEFKSRFATAWRKADSLQEVAEVMGMTKTQASALAKQLRRTIQLKKFKRGRTP